MSASVGRRGRGELKAELVAMLTRADQPMSARELRAGFLGTPTPMTPTTTSILTVLERLRAAGTVGRDAGADGELRFSLVRTEPPRTAQAMLEELLRSGDRSGALLHFAGSLGDDDVAVLRRALDEQEGHGR